MLAIGSVVTNIVWPADAVPTAVVRIAWPAAAEGDVGVAARTMPPLFLNSAALADSARKDSPLLSHSLLKRWLFVAGSPIAEATIAEAIAAQRLAGRFAVEIAEQFVAYSVLL